MIVDLKLVKYTIKAFFLNTLNLSKIFYKVSHWNLQKLTFVILIDIFIFLMMYLVIIEMLFCLCKVFMQSLLKVFYSINLKFFICS